MSLAVEIIPVRGDSQPVFLSSFYEEEFVPDYLAVFEGGLKCPDIKKSILRNDTPTFRFQLKTKVENYWTPIDLTGAVIKFAAQCSDDCQPCQDPIFIKTCVVESPPTQGRFRVSLTGDDTDHPGIFYTEAEVTFLGGERRTFRTFMLYINEDIVQP